MSYVLKGIKYLAGALVFASALLLMMSVQAFADETVDVTVDVQYGQSEAREMLSMVNEFRTSKDDAWYWNEDNTEQIFCTDLSNLTYNYDLEAVAMQRAAEIAVSYSHTRPNGEDCFSLLTSDVGGSYRGENIAAGQTTAAAAFEAWKEADEYYSGQGHRRNMLSAEYPFASIGIGHVYYNGTHYWVQEFGSTTASTTATVANDSITSTSVSVLLSSITASYIVPAVRVSYGDAFEFPTLSSISITTENTWPAGTRVPVNVDYAWEIDDSEYLSFENGIFYTKKAGSTTISTTLFGEPVSMTVTILPLSLSTAVVEVDGDSFTCTGQTITPSVSVVLDGSILSLETDYEVSYSDNVEPGTATATVTGVGNYTGTIAVQFLIVCEHRHGNPSFTWSNGYSSATATFECEICGARKTVAASITSTTSNGMIIYTAEVVLDGVTYSVQAIVSAAQADPNKQTASINQQVIIVSKQKFVLAPGAKMTAKAKGVKTKLVAKGKNKKSQSALKIKIKGKSKIVIKATKKAKRGKTYKIRVWAKQTKKYAKSNVKTIKVKIK